VTYFVLNEV